MQPYSEKVQQLKATAEALGFVTDDKRTEKHKELTMRRVSDHRTLRISLNGLHAYVHHSLLTPAIGSVMFPTTQSLTNICNDK